MQKSCGGKEANKLDFATDQAPLSYLISNPVPKPWYPCI